MSRWWPDRLDVCLAPDRVAVAHHRAAWGVRAWGYRLAGREVLPCHAAPGQPAWGAAVRVLETALGQYEGRHCSAKIVLANNFVRYALVPAGDLGGREEEASLARHCFRELYGEAAARWELRVSPGAPARPRLASGVDADLLEALRAVCAGGRRRLASIQPRLMAVCNRHRSAVGRQPRWLALAEPGSLCLGLAAGGGFLRVRAMRAGADWEARLPELLERECCLAEAEAAPRELLLWCRDGLAGSPSLPGDWRVQALHDGPAGGEG